MNRKGNTKAKTITTTTTRVAAKKQQPRARRARRNRQVSLGQARLESAPVSVAQAQRYAGRGSRGVSWRIRNSELVGNVAGSVDFAYTRYYVNPGMVNTFPWLSQEANRWEQYRFHSLRFRYVTRTATTTIGSIILSPEYNSRDPPPTTETEATNTQDAIEDSPWKNITCTLTPQSMFQAGPRKLVRAAMIAGDINIYDVASLYVASIGMVGTDTVGKLWVDYDVELFVPQNSPADYSTLSAGSMQTRNLVQSIAGGASNLWVGDFPMAYNTLGITTNATPGELVIPAGSYLIEFRATVTAGVIHDTQALVEFRRGGLAMTPPAETLIQTLGSVTVPIASQLVVTAPFVSSGTSRFGILFNNLNATQFLEIVAQTSMLIISPI